MWYARVYFLFSTFFSILFVVDFISNFFFHDLIIQNIKRVHTHTHNRLYISCTVLYMLDWPTGPMDHHHHHHHHRTLINPVQSIRIRSILTNMCAHMHTCPIQFDLICCFLFVCFGIFFSGFHPIHFLFYGRIFSLFLPWTLNLSSKKIGLNPFTLEYISIVNESFIHSRMMKQIEWWKKIRFI